MWPFFYATGNYVTQAGQSKPFRGDWQWHWEIESLYLSEIPSNKYHVWLELLWPFLTTMWAEPGWEESHGWSYFFKGDHKNVSHLMLFFNMPSMKQWGLCSLLLNLENGRSGTVWLLRVGHKRKIRFTWFSWDACSWNPAKQPQGEDPCQCSGQQLQRRSQQPLAAISIHVSE